MLGVANLGHKEFRTLSSRCGVRFARRVPAGSDNSPHSILHSGFHLPRQEPRRMTSQWPASPLTNVSPPDRSEPFFVRLGYPARSSTRPKIVEWELLRASQSESRSCSPDMCPPTECDDAKGKYAPWCNWMAGGPCSAHSRFSP